MNDEGSQAQPPGRVPGRPTAGERAKQATDLGSSSLVAELEPAHLRIAPGTAGTITIRVRNTGAVVDEIGVELRSPAVAWGTVTPESLRLYPGTEGEALLRLEPPREPDPRAGLLEIVVAIRSRERPEASVEQIGMIEIEPYAELTTGLEPRTGSARREWAAAVRLRNGGNRAAEITLAATDPTALLAISVDPAELTLEPGEEAVAWVTVRPPSAIWFGNPRTHPFEVAVTAGSSPQRVLDGRLEQVPIVSRLAVAAITALGAAILAVAVAFAAGIFPGGAPEATATPVVTDAPTATPAVTDAPTATPVVTDAPTATPVVTDAPTATPVVTDAPTPSPPTLFQVTVTFDSVLVLDDADPGLSGVGEVWLQFTVNGETRRWPASGTRDVGTGRTRDLTGVDPIILTLREEDRLVLSVVGFEYDPASENDPLGAIDKTYVALDTWGRGSHDEVSTKPDGQFRLRYTIDVVPSSS